jgi:hypothetical protein
MTEDKMLKLTPVLMNLESAVATWWKHLVKFVMVYVWGLLFGLIPLAVAALVMGINYWLGAKNGPANAIVAVIVFIAALVAFYYFIRGYLGSFLLVKKNYEGEELAIFKETASYFWPYLGLALLTAVFVLLWSLLLIIPGIIYGVFYAFACFAFFFEDKRGRAAIRRSTQLVTGYWWPVFGRLVFIGVIVWIFMMIISVPLYYTSSASPFYQLWNIIVQVISFLIGPIVLIYDYLIYRDLVKIKEHQA